MRSSGYLLFPGCPKAGENGRKSGFKRSKTGPRAQPVLGVVRGSHVTTPIVMLALMMSPYLVVRLLSVVTHRDFNTRGAAAVGLTILFIFTGMSHFIQTEPMAQMLPPWVPERVLLVYLTGILELAVAAGFLVQRFHAIHGMGCRRHARIVFSSKRLRCAQPCPDGRSRMGSHLSFASGSASGHHLTMDLLVRDQAFSVNGGSALKGEDLRSSAVFPNHSWR